MVKQSELDEFVDDSPDEKRYDGEDWLTQKYWDEGLNQEEIAELADVSKTTICKYMEKHGVESRSAMESRHHDESKPHDNKKWLAEKYYNEGLSLGDIADIAGVSLGTIYNRFDEFDLETRGKHEKRVSDEFEKLQREGWLREQYVEQKLSMEAIAAKVNASRNAVRNKLLEFDIEIRDISEANIAANTPPDSPLRDEEWLRSQYHNNGRSMVDIGEQLGRSPSTVGDWMKRHGIERRDHGETVVVAKSGEASEYLTDEEWLKTEYHEKKKSSGGMADEIGVSASAVLNALKRHDIERRDSGESLTIGNTKPLKDASWLRTEYVENQRSQRDIADQLGTTRRTVREYMQRHGIEARTYADRSSGQPGFLHDEEWLRSKYQTEELTQAEIAAEIGVGQSTVDYWLNEHAIETKSISESRVGSAYQQLTDEEWLKRQYRTRERAVPDIAEELDVSKNTVYRWLDRFEIPRWSYRFVETLGHIVRSEWELEIANRLIGLDVEYDYESLTIELPDGRDYTPDFITEDFVIEVKGRLFDESDKRYKAEQTMDTIDDKQYIVIGSELPADHHLNWEDRDELRSILRPDSAIG